MLKLRSKYLFANHLICKQNKQLRLRSTISANPIESTSQFASNTTQSDEWKNAKPYEELPTFSAWDTIRNFMPGGKYSKLDTTEMMNMFYADLGVIGKMKGIFGQPDAVISHDPQDFEKVLRNEGVWPYRPGSEGLRYHRNVHRKEFFQGIEGLIATQGTEWGSFRTAVNPVLMNPKNVKLYLQRMSDVNKEFVERIRQIRDPNTFEVPPSYEEEMNRWTLESVSVVALDKQLGLINKNRDDPKVKQLIQALTDFFAFSVDVEFKPPIWKYYKTKGFKKLMHALDEIVDITSSYVQEAIERIESERKMGVPEKPENEQSVLEKLIKIDKRIATVMAMDMLMAGVDTTSSTFAGLLLCLAKHPEKQQKLRDEVMTLLPNKDSEFEPSSLNNMPYLRACIKESLRYYPLIIGNARVIANDLVLSGYRVPKGTQVSMSSTTLMRNEKHYPRANEYLPERWLRPNKSDSEKSGECPHSLKPSSPFVYLPFGFGARSCVGKRIVELELELGIARLIRNFDIEYNYPVDKPFKSLLISVPAIPLTFKFKDLNY